MKNNFKFFTENTPVNLTDNELPFELEFYLDEDQQVLSFRDDCDNLNDEEIMSVWNGLTQSDLLPIDDLNEIRTVYVNKHINDGEWLLFIYSMDKDGDLYTDVSPTLNYNQLLQLN